MYDKIKLYILAATAAVVPVIVRMTVIDFEGLGKSPISKLVTGPKPTYFHYYKAAFVWVAAALLLFILAGQLIDHKLKIKKDRKLFIPLGIFILFTALSTFLSDLPYVSLWGFFDRNEGFVTYMGYMTLFFAAYSIDFSRLDLKPFVRGLMVSTIILSVMGIAQFYGANFLETKLAYFLTVPKELQPGVPKLVFRFGNIAYATLFNPNYVGSFTAITLPLFLGLFLFENKSRRKFIYFAFCVLTFAFMIASGSRAGLVGVFSAALLLIVMNYRNFKRDWKRYASIMAVFFVVAFVFNFQNPERVFGKLNELFADVEIIAEAPLDKSEGEVPEIDTEDNAPSAEEVEESGIRYGEGFTTLGSGRGYIWYKSFGMMKETLFIGNGPDTYVYNFPHEQAFEEGFNKVTDKPHNLFIQIGINQGLLALLAFVFLNKYAFWKFLKQVDYAFSNRLDQILLMLDAALFGYLVTSLFNDSVVSVAPIYWAMLGIFLSLLLSRKDLEKSKIFDI